MLQEAKYQAVKNYVEHPDRNKLENSGKIFSNASDC